MIAISTSYFSIKNVSGDEIIRRLAALDISKVELSYNIDENTFIDLRKALNRLKIQISSAHNFFPIPESAPNGEGDGDIFLLSHPDEEERCKAVEWTKRSIEQAGAAGAKALVLHCGRVEMNAELEQLYAYFRNGQIHAPLVQKFIKIKLGERENKNQCTWNAFCAAWKNLYRQQSITTAFLALKTATTITSCPVRMNLRSFLKNFPEPPSDTGMIPAMPTLSRF